MITALNLFAGYILPLVFLVFKAKPLNELFKIIVYSIESSSRENEKLVLNNMA